MRCLAALLLCLAASSVDAKCVGVTEAAATIAKENPKARVSILLPSDVADLKAFFEADGSIAGKAEGFVSVAFPDKLVIVPVFAGVVCDELPVTMLEGPDRDPIRHHLLRSRARKGLPAPVGWVTERRA